MIEENGVDGTPVSSETLQSRIDSLECGVVGCEEGEAVVTSIESVKEGDVRSRVQRRVIEGKSRAG